MLVTLAAQSVLFRVLYYINGWDLPKHLYYLLFPFIRKKSKEVFEENLRYCTNCLLFVLFAPGVIRGEKGLEVLGHSERSNFKALHMPD